MFKRFLFLLGALPSMALAHTALHESWVVTTDLWGNPSYQALEWA